MLRRSLLVVLMFVALASGVEAAHKTPPNCPKGSGGCCLFGGYGPGPFGYGDFTYAGTSSRTVFRHHVLVPSYTTRAAQRSLR